MGRFIVYYLIRCSIFFLAWISLVSIVIAILYVVGHPGFNSVWLLAIPLAAFLALLKLRSYLLKAQDRVIRLEERLRFQALVPAERHNQIHRLSEDELDGLRFASDEEIVELAQQALEQNLNRREIKERIKWWRKRRKPNLYRRELVGRPQNEPSCRTRIG